MRQHFGTLQGHRDMVNDVAFSPDGGAIATVSGDYTARIWDTQTGQELATLPGSAWMGQVALVFRRRICRRDHRLETDGLPLSCHGPAPRPAAAHRPREPGSCAVAAHPRLEQFATFRPGACHLGRYRTPRPSPRRLGTETGLGTALAYSPNGSLLATGTWFFSSSRVSRIMLRDSRRGKSRPISPAPRILRALAFDPAGKRLASGDVGGNLVVWDL